VKIYGNYNHNHLRYNRPC